MRTSRWVTTQVEVQRNLRRNAGPACAVILVIGTVLALVGTIAQWAVTVSSALRATIGSQARLSAIAQSHERWYLLPAALIAASIVIVAVTFQAMGGRRRQEREMFEVLGAPKTYTDTPALIESLIQGFGGGLLAGLLTLATRTDVVAWERSSLPGTFVVTTINHNGATSSSLFTLPSGAIVLSWTAAAEIAAALVAGGAVLGVTAAWWINNSGRKNPSH